MSGELEVAGKLGEMTAEVRSLNTRIADFIEVTRQGMAEQKADTNKLTARVVILEQDKAVVLGKIRTLQWIVGLAGTFVAVLTAIGAEKLAILLGLFQHLS